MRTGVMTFDSNFAKIVYDAKIEYEQTYFLAANKRANT